MSEPIVIHEDDIVEFQEQDGTLVSSCKIIEVYSQDSVRVKWLYLPNGQGDVSHLVNYDCYDDYQEVLDPARRGPDALIVKVTSKTKPVKLDEDLFTL